MKKSITLIIAIVALWLVGTATVTWGQEGEQQEQAKPVPQETKSNKPEPKPQEPKQEPGGEMKPAKPQEDQRRPQQEQQKQVEEQQKRTQQDQAEQQKRAQEDARRVQEQQQKEQTKRADEDKQRQNQHQTASSPGSRSSSQRGVRIPEDRFRAQFGREHHFRVQRIILVEDRPRFQYSGYWFELADPWPADWSYADDCYVDYVDDGYFLFSPLHPGIRIAVIVIE